MLKSMGARSTGLVHEYAHDHGRRPKLHGARHRVVSDHIEAGSFLALAAATGGGVTVRDTVRGHYWMMQSGIRALRHRPRHPVDRIHLAPGQVAKIRPDAGGRDTPQVDDGPWPQFPTDMMSPMLVLATQSEGTVLFFEKMFESRMFFVDPLVQMGANIILCDPHRVVVTGKTTLRGQTVRSPDIRAGMALMIAALCAEHRPSIVQNAEILDRGYEKLEHKLQSLGADIAKW